MSAAMVLLLSQAGRKTGSFLARSHGAPPITPAPEESHEVGPDLKKERLPERPIEATPAVHFDLPKEAKKVAAALIGGIAEDRSNIIAARLEENLKTNAFTLAAKAGVGPEQTEAELVKSAIGQLIAPHRKYGLPDSLFKAADTLWERASQLGVEIHPNWEGQLRRKLEKELNTAIHAGMDQTCNYSRARFLLRDGAELFTELKERSWLSNPFILAGAAIARAVGGTPAFSVADALAA